MLSGWCGCQIEGSAREESRPTGLYDERGLTGSSPAKPSTKTTNWSHIARCLLHGARNVLGGGDRLPLTSCCRAPSTPVPGLRPRQVTIAWSLATVTVVELDIVVLRGLLLAALQEKKAAISRVLRALISRV